MADPSTSRTSRADSTTASPGAGGMDGAGLVKTPWDWVGIIGTGQSLSVGTTPITSTTQAYGNLMFSVGARRSSGTSMATTRSRSRPAH